MLKKTALFTVFCLLLFVFLAACGIEPVKRAGGTPAPSDAASPAPSGEPQGGGETAEPEITPEPSSGPAAPDAVLQVDGEDIPAYRKTGKLRASPALSYEILIAEGYELAASEDGDSYRYASAADESGQTFIELGFAAGLSAEELAPSFMNGYLDFKSIEFSSYVKVGKDGLDAYQIKADNETLHAEAYLIDREGGAAYLALCCGESVLEQCLPRLEAMRDTLILESR
jgi:hypothetical protein